MHIHPGPVHIHPGPVHIHPGPLHIHPGPVHIHPDSVHIHPGPVHIHPGPVLEFKVKVSESKETEFLPQTQIFDVWWCKPLIIQTKALGLIEFIVIKDVHNRPTY